MLCGTVALLCLFSMFVPIVAPHYSAQEYHPADDSYTKDYFLSGDYYCAREYWSIVRFASQSMVMKVILSLSMALTLYWCVCCFMGEHTLTAGIAASGVNLAVTAFFVVKMLSMMAACRPFVIVVVLVDATAAVICAIFSKPRKKKYSLLIIISNFFMTSVEKYFSPHSAHSMQGTFFMMIGLPL